MNGFIMVEEFEIQVPEPENNGSQKNEKKNSLEGKNGFYFIGKESGLLHVPHPQLSSTISIPISFGT